MNTSTFTQKQEMNSFSNSILEDIENVQQSLRWKNEEAIIISLDVQNSLERIFTYCQDQAKSNSHSRVSDHSKDISDIQQEQNNIIPFLNQLKDSFETFQKEILKEFQTKNELIYKKLEGLENAFQNSISTNNTEVMLQKVIDQMNDSQKYQKENFGMIRDEIKDFKENNKKKIIDIEKNIKEFRVNNINYEENKSEILEQGNKTNNMNERILSNEDLINQSDVDQCNILSRKAEELEKKIKQLFRKVQTPDEPNLEVQNSFDINDQRSLLKLTSNDKTLESAKGALVNGIFFGKEKLHAGKRSFSINCTNICGWQDSIFAIGIVTKNQAKNASKLKCKECYVINHFQKVVYLNCEEHTFRSENLNPNGIISIFLDYKNKRICFKIDNSTFEGEIVPEHLEVELYPFIYVQKCSDIKISFL